jgi:hypothetical protein
MLERQDRTGYGKLDDQTPIGLRLIIETYDFEREEAARVLLEKLQDAHRNNQPVDERFLRCIEEHVKALQPDVQKLRFLIKGGRPS